MKRLISGLAMSLILFPVCAGAAGWKAISSASDVPQAVRQILSNCEYVTDRTAEWLNGHNLALITLGQGATMYFSTCNDSASQIFRAIVIVKNGKTKRLVFDHYDDGRVKPGRDVLANASWNGSKKELSSIETIGCASPATRYVYKWNGKKFTLVEQSEGDGCAQPVEWKRQFRAK